MSVFDNKLEEPTLADLDQKLEKTAILLKDIEQYLYSKFGELTHEWKFYSKKAGWTLALIHKGRRVFHLIPQSGFFTVFFTLGRQAVSVAQESSLPDEILSALENAREYAEGRSIRFDVTTKEDIVVVKQLIAIKMSN